MLETKTCESYAIISCMLGKAILMMLDYSYSMQSNVILAAITAAAIAQHYKKDYAVLAFNSGVCILKDIDETAGPEKGLRRLFA